jgi:serine/threonine protein kinase
MGSPAYFSPELVKGREVDYRADQFALGTVMIEMLGGRCIFGGSNVYETIHRVAEVRTPQLTELGIVAGSDVEEIVLKLHKKAPEDRFADEGELVQMLTRCSSRRTAV